MGNNESSVSQNEPLKNDNSSLNIVNPTETQEDIAQNAENHYERQNREMLNEYLYGRAEVISEDLQNSIFIDSAHFEILNSIQGRIKSLKKEEARKIPDIKISIQDNEKEINEIINRNKMPRELIDHYENLIINRYNSLKSNYQELKNELIPRKLLELQKLKEQHKVLKAKFGELCEKALLQDNF
jgi:hypothetical protein